LLAKPDLHFLTNSVRTYMADLINSTLDDISSVIGFSATIRLAANYGDRDVNVPLVVSDLHPVAKLIGMSRMTALHANWQGDRIAVPSLKIVESEIRRAKILSLLLQGINTYTIAEVMALTDRRVYQLKKEFVDAGLLDAGVPGKKSR
jgi:hypothetical protein